jgi:hypothetical protein
VVQESSDADRLMRERDEAYRRNREAERVRLEEKFLSGADRWISIVAATVEPFELLARKTSVGSFTELEASGRSENS